MRGRRRFEGSVAEPRPGLRSGHIPGARSVPYATLFDAETGAMKSLDQLRAAFSGAGVDTSKPIVTSCGSGVSAGVLTLALYRLGVENPRCMTAHGRSGASRAARRSRPDRRKEAVQADAVLDAGADANDVYLRSAIRSMLLAKRGVSSALWACKSFTMAACAGPASTLLSAINLRNSGVACTATRLRNVHRPFPAAVAFNSQVMCSLVRPLRSEDIAGGDDAAMILFGNIFIVVRDDQVADLLHVDRDAFACGICARTGCDVRL